jgi:hypothetical protein
MDQVTFVFTAGGLGQYNSKGKHYGVTRLPIYVKDSLIKPMFVNAKLSTRTESLRTSTGDG